MLQNVGGEDIVEAPTLELRAVGHMFDFTMKAEIFRIQVKACPNEASATKMVEMYPWPASDIQNGRSGSPRNCFQAAALAG